MDTAALFDLSGRVALVTGRLSRRRADGETLVVDGGVVHARLGPDVDAAGKSAG